jgi:hypothetical protein
VVTEYDPLPVELVGNEPSDWTRDLFPHLWSRITILEEHLQAAKLWNIWILFRDRRDTLQFWTFLLATNASIRSLLADAAKFATIVVILAVIQVIIGVAPVVGSFH